MTPKALASGTAELTQTISQYNKPNLFTWAGGIGQYDPNNHGFKAPVVTVKTGGNFTATKTCLAPRTSFITDAVTLDLFCRIFNYRILVNGQYVGKTVRTDG